MNREIKHCSSCGTETVHTARGECPWPHPDQPKPVTNTLPDLLVADMYAMYQAGLTMGELVDAFPNALPFARRHSGVVIAREFENRGWARRDPKEAQQNRRQRESNIGVQKSNIDVTQTVQNTEVTHGVHA